MSFSATAVRILISSPGDVEAERAAIVRVIGEWNSINSMGAKVILLPVLWKKDARPEMGDRPQALLNEQLVENCDILIAAFWTRLGTPTGAASSGTVEEIEEFRKAGKEILIYFSSKEVDLTSVNFDQYSSLKKYREDLSQKCLYWEYKTIEEFERLLLNHLSGTIQDKFGSPEIETIKKLEKDIETVNLKQIKDSLLAPKKTEGSIDLSKVKYEFHNQLMTLEESVRDGKERDIFPLDTIMQEASSVSEVVKKVYSASPEAFSVVSKEIKSLIDDLVMLSQHKLYMDGGASYRKFWSKAEKVLDDFRSVIELM